MALFLSSPSRTSLALFQRASWEHGSASRPLQPSRASILTGKGVGFAYIMQTVRIIGRARARCSDFRVSPKGFFTCTDGGFVEFFGGPIGPGCCNCPSGHTAEMHCPCRISWDVSCRNQEHSAQFHLSPDWAQHAARLPAYWANAAINKVSLTDLDLLTPHKSAHCWDSSPRSPRLHR